MHTRSDWLHAMLVATVHGVALLRAGVAASEGLSLDREPGAREVSYSPADGGKAVGNPPAFVWLPVEGAKRYVVQVSRSREFPSGATIQREGVFCIEVPRQPLEPGQWHWRYGAEADKGAGVVWSRVRSFEVPSDAPRIPFPDVGEVVRRLSGIRPRIALRPGDLERLRAEAVGEMGWAVVPLLRSAEAAIGKPLMSEPPAVPTRGDQGRAAVKKTAFGQSRAVTGGLNDCAEAHLITADERFGQEARRRLVHLMSWDPNGSSSLASNDGQATEITRVGSRAYDYIHPLLSEAERAKCREVLAARMQQLYRALREIPFETSPFRSHTMGWYVPDLTEACLAMAGEAPVEEMLDYCLRQFWSPFYPPFGGEDGGWS
ncbi:MAG: DUF4962 domain-containing protein, partial [Planctomycetes bacterium]|nr:DUF4962 domain-containing protein [Planctomycetota bacterium]